MGGRVAETRMMILVADDHPLVRGALKEAVIGFLPQALVLEAGTFEEVSAHLGREGDLDLILLDLTMPGGGSLPLIEKLHASDRVPRVLVLTMHDDPAYVRAALAAGASGYVVKTIQERDLLEAIRTVSRGRLIIDLDDEQRTAAVFDGTLGGAAAAIMRAISWATQ